MSPLRKSALGIVAGVVLASGALVATYWAIDDKHLNPNALTAVGTVGAAVASAIAAIAAWFAASKSSEVSRHATEALGRATAPQLRVDLAWEPSRVGPPPPEGGFKLDAWLIPLNPHAAIDLEGKVTLADGSVHPLSRSRLEGAPEPNESRVCISLGEGLPTPGEGREEVVVTFWDERRMLQWEYKLWRTYRKPPPDRTDASFLVDREASGHTQRLLRR